MILITAVGCAFCAFCESERVFILCDPRTPVNVRASPKKGTDIVGRLDFGDWIETDGEERNGFLHVYGIGEAGEGWLYSGYVVEDQPHKVERWAYVDATGRVKSYRWIGGKRLKWLTVGSRVKVYGRSEEWAVTNKGYVRTAYLEWGSD